MGSRGCDAPSGWRDKTQVPGYTSGLPGSAPCHPHARAPKIRGLLLIWMREEYCWLSISSPVLIMRNIGQPQSLQAVIIKSPWSRQLGNERSGLALNARSLGIRLTLSCSFYEVLTLISAAVTTAGSSAGAHLQKWLLPQWSKQQLQLEKKYKNQNGSTIPRVWFTWIYLSMANKIKSVTIKLLASKQCRD